MGVIVALNQAGSDLSPGYNGTGEKGSWSGNKLFPFQGKPIWSPAHINIDTFNFYRLRNIA